MDKQTLASCYRLLSELFLYPEMRDNELIETECANIGKFPKAVREPIEVFLKDPVSASTDEYINTLELTPPCPLYLGTYLFDEPNSCRGAGTSGRNSYMMELSGVYNHFGFELNGKELSDFLPLMLDFLAVSLEREECDKIGVRRRFVEHHFLLGVPPMVESMQKYESVYASLAEALKEALEEDAIRMEDQPVWNPPANEDHPPESACGSCNYDFLSDEEKKKEQVQ